MLIHSKRSHRSIAKIEGTLINTEHIIYSFSVSATIAWLSIYRRAAGPAPSSKKLSRITSRHTTVVKWGRRILRRNSGTCPSSGWLFLKHAVRFFSATQWRTFYRDCSARSAVRMVVMDAENLFSGNHDGKHDHRVQPCEQSFFIFFSSWCMCFDFKNNQIKKRDFPLFISMYGSQIMRASSPICSPSM